jgi:medium-chain acyl-[acyl-carrier-protein] hydrolase
MTMTGPSEPIPKAAQTLAGHHDLGPYSFLVRATDADWQDQLNPAALFSMIQEAAYRNAEALGMGASRLDQEGLCWILMRFSIRLDHLPRWNDTVTIDTWHRGTSKLVFLRDFEFYSRQGRIFGAATSEWLVADQRTHRPQRPQQVFPGIGAQTGARAALSGEPGRLQPLPEESFSQPCLTVHANFSDIDRNGHVNSARYAAWCLDAVVASLGAGLPRIRISSIDIQYVNEVFYGTTISCYCRHAPPGDGSGSSRSCQVEARRDGDGARVFRALVGWGEGS